MRPGSATRTSPARRRRGLGGPRPPPPLTGRAALHVPEGGPKSGCDPEARPRTYGREVGRACAADGAERGAWRAWRSPARSRTGECRPAAERQGLPQHRPTGGGRSMAVCRSGWGHGLPPARASQPSAGSRSKAPEGRGVPYGLSPRGGGTTGRGGASRGRGRGGRDWVEGLGENSGVLLSGSSPYAPLSYKDLLTVITVRS